MNNKADLLGGFKACGVTKLLDNSYWENNVLEGSFATEWAWGAGAWGVGTTALVVSLEIAGTWYAIIAWAYARVIHSGVWRLQIWKKCSNVTGLAKPQPHMLPLLQINSDTREANKIGLQRFNMIIMTVLIK